MGSAEGDSVGAIGDFVGDGVGAQLLQGGQKGISEEAVGAPGESVAARVGNAIGTVGADVIGEMIGAVVGKSVDDSVGI